MKISDYLPQAKAEKKRLIQGCVSEGLRKRTRAKLQALNIGWDQFMEAACKSFLEDPK